MGLGGQRHAFPPGETQYSLYRKLGRPRDQSGWGRKISLPPEFDPRTVQPIASHCTDWAIVAYMCVHVRVWVKWKRKIFISLVNIICLWNCRSSWTIWCADPWFISSCVSISFTVTQRLSFTMASSASMASGVTTGYAWPGRGESVTELMPFVNFLAHSYTYCSDRHASPHWAFIRRWISMGFTPSLRRSSLVHGASGAAVFTLLLRCHVPFLHHTATCQPLFKPRVSLLSTYKTDELCFEFLSHF
jgi:hypothetical protein